MISDDEVARRIKAWGQGYWEIPEGLNTEGFDFDWRPNPYDRPYIHQFGTQWQKTGGPRFVLPDNEGIKYQDSQYAVNLPDEQNRAWRPLKTNATIDFSWHPDENDPPYIYVFGNQWYSGEEMPTFQYRVKGATEKKYISNVKATLLPTTDNWEIPENIKDFDYSWVPHPYDPPGFIYQFGTQWQKTGGPRYVTENAHTVKYVDDIVAIRMGDPNDRHWRPLVNNVTIDFSWHPDETEPPYIYVFGNQWYDSTTMPTIQYRVKGATVKKYMDLKATLLPDLERWITPDDIEDDFDYSWRPNPNDPPFIYQFGTQHQKTGGPAYVVKDATTVKYIDCLVATKKANMRHWRIPEEIEPGFDFTWHPDDTEPPFIYQFGTQWQKTGGPLYVARGATITKYCDAQIAIRKPNKRNWRVIEAIQHNTFDFSWHPDETEEPYTYVFGNEYFPPEVMPTVVYRCKNSVDTKYITDIKAKLQVDVVEYQDSIFNAVKDYPFTTKYVHFTKTSKKVDYEKVIPNIENNLYLHILNDYEAVVPVEAKEKMYDKLSDYPFTMYHRLSYDNPKPLDIIFLSNGEESADENFVHLIHITKNLPNNIFRIDGINGRVASQHAAAKQSLTDWYFLVNGKLKVNSNFDFSWQPNRLSDRRHYIFTATNPVNGLEYGHQAIVANNKLLTLNTKVHGLDFTMDSPTEVVDINSGIGKYNTSVWDTWRTAFRECVKLCHYTDKESKARLEAWLNNGFGEYGEYSIQGAKDAVQYYESVGGNLDKLMLSYDWDWLKQYYTQTLDR